MDVVEQQEPSQLVEDNKETEVKTNSCCGILKVKKIYEYQFILFGKHVKSSFRECSLTVDTGFAMILGSRSSTWSSGLIAGYHSVLFNLLFAGSGYLCLCLCMGEMSSALPFSGGIFGFVRAALGPFYGFMVASCEVAYCLTYVVILVTRLMIIAVSSGEVSAASGMILVLSSYFIVLCVNLVGGRPLFMIMSLAGFLTFGLMMMYLIGTVKDAETNAVDFETYAAPFKPLTFEGIMRGCKSAQSQYNGLQYLPLLSEYLPDPRVQMPRSLIANCVTYILFSVMISLAAVSQWPGTLGLDPFQPLTYGFARMLHIEIRTASWLQYPCVWGGLCGLFHCSGKQLFSISKSGLLPKTFMRTSSGTDTPYVCYTFLACFGAGLNMYALINIEALGEIENISLMASYIVFIFCFIAYITFRYKFASMAKSFVSPLGIFGAIYGIFQFLVSLTGLVVYSDVAGFFFLAFFLYIVFMAIFFWVYLVRHQKFSEEEKKLMFKAYLINANRQNRLKKKNNNKNNQQKPGEPVSSTNNLTANKVTRTNKKSKSQSKSKSKSVTQTKSKSKLYFPSSLCYPYPHNCLSFVVGVALTSFVFKTNTIHPDPVSVHSKVSQHQALTLSDKQPKKVSKTYSQSGSLHFGRSEREASSTREAEEVEDEEEEDEEEDAQPTLSSKIIDYISGKLTVVTAPLMNRMYPAEWDDYQHLAVMSTGGILDSRSQKVLQEKLGMDIESSEVVCNDEEVEGEEEGAEGDEEAALE